MKIRYWLLTGVGIWAISGTANAAVSCATPPSCEEMGYTMSASDCSGVNALKCPSDYTKLFCGSASSASTPTCVVGSVLYDDKKCYDTAPSGRTAIGVVFDTSKRLAIALDQKNNIKWGVYGTDISTMRNCTESNYTSCDTDGKTNTDRIVTALGSNSDYAAGYCRSKGSEWFLPSASELMTLYNNKTTVNNGISSIGGTQIPTTAGYYWSSTECSSYVALRLTLATGTVYTYGKNTISSLYYARCAVAF